MIIAGVYHILEHYRGGRTLQTVMRDERYCFKINWF